LRAAWTVKVCNWFSILQAGQRRKLGAHSLDRHQPIVQI